MRINCHGAGAKIKRSAGGQRSAGGRQARCSSVAADRHARSATALPRSLQARANTCAKSAELAQGGSTERGVTSELSELGLRKYLGGCRSLDGSPPAWRYRRSVHTAAHPTWEQAAGRKNGANSPIDSWQHEHEGGAEREAMASRHTLTTGSAHCTVKRRGSGWEPGRTKLPNPRSPDAFRRRITRGGGWGGVTIDQAEASIPPRVLRIPPYHC